MNCNSNGNSNEDKAFAFLDATATAVAFTNLFYETNSQNSASNTANTTPTLMQTLINRSNMSPIQSSLFFNRNNTPLSLPNTVISSQQASQQQQQPLNGEVNSSTSVENEQTKLISANN